MVYKITDSKNRVFIESLILTLLILLIGFSIGYYVELYRTNVIAESYQNDEITNLDVRLQNYYYQIMSRTACDKAIEQNFIFADEVYDKGLTIENYEQANQISEDIKREKKKYVLLKTELWLNTLLLREKCNATFDTIVYFYSNDPSNNLIVSQQEVISNVLKTIKEERGNGVILIPIAADMGLDIVDMQEKIYGIAETPAVLVNEKFVLYGFNKKEDIEKYLNNASIQSK